MEQLMHIMTLVTTMGPEVMKGLLMVLGGFAILAKLTPTEADDKIVQFILNLIHLGALNLKKDGQ